MHKSFLILAPVYDAATTTLKKQIVIMVILAVAGIALVTTLSMIYLQTVLSIFYSTTVDAFAITLIIIGTNKLLHDRLVKAQ